jgi:atypical dual specificity phosphatase
MRIRLLHYSLASLTTLFAGACTAGNQGESFSMQDGFSWVIENQLAGMSYPGSVASMEEDAEFLADHGIDVLISLTGGVPDPDVLARYRIESFHLPIEDFRPPTLEQQVSFVEKTAQTLANGGRVGVHCAAGIGRTGTMLATYLVYLGSTAEDAISRVRQLRPGSIETGAQEDSIRAYYEHLQSR